MIRTILITLALSLGAAHALESDPSITVLEGLRRGENYSTFLGLLEGTYLRELLEGTGPFTVLAPTNAAFERYNPEELGRITADPALLEAVLVAHIIEGTLDVIAFSEARQTGLTSLQGEPLVVTQRLLEGLRVNEAGFTATDVDNRYRNGVVHGMSNLVIPASLAVMLGDGRALLLDPVSEPLRDPNAETLETAAATRNALGLIIAQNTLDDLLRGDDTFNSLRVFLADTGLMDFMMAAGPYTLFAPTNPAFDALTTDITMLPAALDLVTLERILGMHIVEGFWPAVELAAAGTLTTVSGETLVFTAEDVVRVNGVPLSTADIEAANGIMHVLDAVLLPEEFRQ